MDRSTSRLQTPDARKRRFGNGKRGASCRRPQTSICANRVNSEHAKLSPERTTQPAAARGYWSENRFLPPRALASPAIERRLKASNAVLFISRDATIPDSDVDLRLRWVVRHRRPLLRRFYRAPSVLVRFGSRHRRLGHNLTHNVYGRQPPRCLKIAGCSPIAQASFPCSHADPGEHRSKSIPGAGSSSI